MIYRQPYINDIHNLTNIHILLMHAIVTHILKLVYNYHHDGRERREMTFYTTTHLANKAWMLNRTVLICSAGDHLSFRISRQIRPIRSTLGWYNLVKNRTNGGSIGYPFGRNNSSLNTPPKATTTTHTRHTSCVMYTLITNTTHTRHTSCVMYTLITNTTHTRHTACVLYKLIKEKPGVIGCMTSIVKEVMIKSNFLALFHELDPTRFISPISKVTN